MKKFYERNALENIARKELLDFDKSLLTNYRETPIESMIEDAYSLSIAYHSLRRNGRFLGRTVFHDGLVPIYDHELKTYMFAPFHGGTIIVDELLLKRENEGRLRFTLAHELAHWILHMDYFSEDNERMAAKEREYFDENPRCLEWQADYFASALLMPPTMVKRAFYDNQGKGNIIQKLSRIFNVSKQAMEIFLKEHNLVA